ncbi:MAG: hypothetical protein AAF629_22145 [Chloroflexota bacterium]
MIKQMQNFCQPIIWRAAFTISLLSILVACSPTVPDNSLAQQTTPPVIQVTSRPTQMSPTSTVEVTETALSTATNLPATATISPTNSLIQEPTNTATLVPSPTLSPTPVPPQARQVRIGLHGRNNGTWQEQDYQMVKTAGIETLKMMSLTAPTVFDRLKRENPNIEFIVRLYDDRLNEHGHPSPEDYAGRMIPLLSTLQPYATKFEIGNEPNHFRRVEGWGPEDADAQDFNTWFLAVYDLLKTAHPWAELGFPALGTPDEVHRDKAWLKYNVEAINKADWLGVHCYWQTNPDGSNTMFDEDHGLCFKYYHALFPNKPIELTEFDNDNIYYNLEPISEDQMATETVAYFQELYKYPYIRSASSFIMSSSDTGNWSSFVWRTEDGHIKPVVAAVGAMPRPALIR